jgi:hypothetical protein
MFKHLKSNMLRVAGFSVLPFLVCAHTVSAQSENAWYQAGQAELKAKLARKPITGTAKNVIMFLADGNGVASEYATRLFQGQQNGGYGDENIMAKETMPYLALAKTYNTNAQTPDSAGTAVAFLSGIKTNARMSQQLQYHRLAIWPLRWENQLVSSVRRVSPTPRLQLFTRIVRIEISQMIANYQMGVLLLISPLSFWTI